MKIESKKKHIQDAGLKVTTPRMVILGILEESPHLHMSAEDIYQILLERGYDFSLATVYRVLTQFEKSDLVVRHRFEGDKCVYELAGDEHHDHLVCLKCGNIEEFHDGIIEARQEEIANNFCFKMTDHTLSIYGLCKLCQ